MELFEILLTAASVFVVLYLLWYFFFTDSDIFVYLANKFGRPVSSFQKKVIWVTGASTGLGEAIAHELASVGAKLILTARNENLLEKVKEKCLELGKEKLEYNDILVLPFDLTNREVHETKVQEAVEHFGQIDILINNAARYQVGPISSTEHEVEMDVFEVNFFGPINLTKLVLKHFFDKGKGQIVVVTSMAGKCGVPSCASYGATKHALHGYFEALRMECRNINVTMVCPGIFRSAMAWNAMGTKKNQGYYEALRMEHHMDKIHVSIVCPGIFKSAIFGKTHFTTKGEVTNMNHYECSQMSSARCAHLTLVAAANKLGEAWVANQPFLLMMWAAQYIPAINRRVMSSLVYNKRRVQELNKGSWPKDIRTWQPLFR